ncbi:MAG: hypothetical protein PWP48_290 [Clostridiales bacterium]|nr:hypothetical protein [Clostridiales bacterium]
MKKGLIAVLIAANLLMLVIGILIIPPNLRSADGKDSPVPETEQTAPITPSPEEETPPATKESGSIPAPEVTGVSLSTEERPDLEDFLWYTEDVAYDGVPSDANIIDNIGSLTGSWKALIIYDPNNEYDAGAMEFLNVALAGAAESLSLTLDWYQIFWANEGESFDEADMEDGVFSGKWENGGLWASGAGTIRLTQFYEQNGKQYAVGTMDTPDGTPALVALVRP